VNDTLYLPLAAALAERVARASRCLVVGIAGAQGTGKSTLSAALQGLLTQSYGLRSLVVSLDDYYLPKAARRALARDIHPLLATRGVPGTHEISRLHQVVRQLREAAVGEPVELLRFSKAQDERASETQHCQGAFDLVLLEGWCVGARPQAELELQSPINALERSEDSDGSFRRFVNRALAGDYAALWSELDMLIFLAAPDIETVRVFRAQQEHALRATADAAAIGVMNDAQLTRFLAHFERLTRHMLREAPGYAEIVVELEADRRVRALRFTEGRPACVPR
jgi:D-glycerate 3-kinase